MCYSGKCEFENYFGECTICSFKKFEDKYKYSPCFVGGIIQSKEDEIFYKKHEEEIEKIKENINR